MVAYNKSLLIAAVAAIVLCVLAAQASAFQVDLFEQKHFKGRSTSIDVRGCTEIPVEWDDIVSSVEPSQCVIIFKHPKCQGPRVRLEPYAFGTAYLREINFEDKLSSIAPCNIAISNNPPAARENQREVREAPREVRENQREVRDRDEY